MKNNKALYRYISLNLILFTRAKLPKRLIES